MSNHFSHNEIAEKQSVKTLGFWVYIMTDCVLFATLFATFAVLRTATAGGPAVSEIIDLPFVLGETMLLLTSSFTIGLAVLAAKSGKRITSMVWIAATFLLGAGFLAMELHEFSSLIAEGTGWQRSAFLSSYFVLVGTHGIHIAIGLLWMAVLAFRLMQRSFKDADVFRLSLLGLFWHFLDIIWIFIFSIVYLMGSVS